MSELNHASRAMLERQFGIITVLGEISSFTNARSGHWYFNLKDQESQVRCAMFRNRNVYCQTRPKDGDLVHLRAKVSLYPERGEYQLIGETFTPAGEGLLQLAFQELKTKLEQEGLFDPARKKPIPEHCRRIAIISSANGAAIHDFISVAGARMPSLHIDLLPVPVQGQGAAQASCKAIELCNLTGLHDVIVLTRGGGSLEDLWSFNDEALARTIAASPMPIISAIGHETDFTIADFVADLRAPTPSAAAAAVTQDQNHLHHKNLQLKQRLSQAMQSQLRQQRLRTTTLYAALKSPQQQLQDVSQKLDKLIMRLETQLNHKLNRLSNHAEQLHGKIMQNSPNTFIRLQRQVIVNISQRQDRNFETLLKTRRERLSYFAGMLHQLSPLQTLGRGFSITEDLQGNIITNAKQVKPTQRLVVRLREGKIFVTNDS